MNKKAILLIITAAIAISIALVLYLNSNKNKIINDLISKAIKSNTLNLYNVKYDESTVNLTNKELHFTDISIEVDSSKLSKLAELHQSPRNIFQIKIKSVTAEGIDIPLAIFENKIKANKLIIHEPEITITINKNLVEKIEDSTNFLQKLIEAIHPLNAETIDISKAKLIVINSNKNIILRVANLNISLLKFSTDSPHNYSNSSRHFAYKVNTNIEQINLYPEINNKEIQLENISWDAVEKTILIEKFLVKNEEKLNVPNVIHSIKIEGIDMEECLYKKNIHISNITAKTCKFSIDLPPNQSKLNGLRNTTRFENLKKNFNNVIIGGLTIGKSTIILKSGSNPEKAPIQINEFEFQLNKKVTINQQSNLSTIVETAQWAMKANEIITKSNDNRYQIIFNKIKVDNTAASASIGSLQVIPIAKEDAPSASYPYQQDVYNIILNNIQLTGLEIKNIMSRLTVSIAEATMNFDAKVFRDRGPAVNQKSLIGNYPHQLLRKIEFPINIQSMIIYNSAISYRERSNETREIGNIFFTKINGQIKNICNNPNLINRNAICKVNASGLFLSKTKCITTWTLPLNSNTGAFSVNGHLESLNLSEVNAVTKPLALTTLDGHLNSLHFSMSGNDLAVAGNLTFLYSNLQLNAYKYQKHTHTYILQKNKSLLNNLFVKNHNPSGGRTRKTDFSIRRDIHKSFFNLIWKGLHQGIENTIISKKVAALKKQINEK